MKLAGGQVASLPEGQVATNAPTAMTIGDPKEVNATVGIGVTAEQLKANQEQIVQLLARASQQQRPKTSAPPFPNSKSATKPSSQARSQLSIQARARPQ